MSFTGGPPGFAPYPPPDPMNSWDSSDNPRYKGMDLLELGGPPRKQSSHVPKSRRETYKEMSRTTCWKPLAIVLFLLVLGLLAVIALVLTGQLDIFNVFGLLNEGDGNNSTTNTTETL